MRKIKKEVKRKFYKFIIIVVFLSIGIYAINGVIKKMNYEKTYEYKLTQIGYSLDDAKKIDSTYKDKEKDYILKNKMSTLYLNLANEKYFIYNNFYDYVNFYKDDDNIRDIIEKVNVKTINEYYTNILETDTSKNELILVNKYYALKENYEPDNLVNIPQTYSWGTNGSQKCVNYVYDAFLDMWNEANKEGYYLMVSSSYRNYQDQDNVYTEYKESKGTDYADSIAARPGHSEHQTGLALDIFEKTDSRQSTFHETEVYNWLKNNSYKYGFILRYPEDKVDITGYGFESWHYRYVGEDIAKYIYENNITFDEYYAYFIK